MTFPVREVIGTGHQFLNPVKKHPEIPMGLPISSSAYKDHSVLTTNKKMKKLKNKQLCNIHTKKNKG